MLLAQRRRKRTPAQMLFNSIDLAWRRSVADGTYGLSQLLAEAKRAASIQVDQERADRHRSNRRISA